VRVYDRPLEASRRPWQRRIEVFSPKLGRRLTLFSYAAHDAWLLLEADPKVKRFCERPAPFEGEARRTLDFWVDYGRRAVFWVLGGDVAEREVLPKRMHELPLEVLKREDLLALATRIRNWSVIVPYLVAARRFVYPRLEHDLHARLAKPHRLTSLERAFAPVEPSTVRAALFALLARGELAAPDLDRMPLGPQTFFRRARR
jgi:hypothetical protein